MAEQWKTKTFSCHRAMKHLKEHVIKLVMSMKVTV